MEGQPPLAPVPAQQPAPAPKTVGLAIASLTFGILGLMCLLPLISPILAIIFGIIALIKVSNSRGTLRGQGQAIAGLLLGCIGLVMVPIMAGMLLPALAATRERARRVQCMNNEKQIAVAMRMYTADHEGRCTQNLDDLRKYVVSENVFHCPSAPDQSAPSYDISCSTNMNDIVVSESSDNHRGNGHNLTYGDGHVQWIPTPRSRED